MAQLFKYPEGRLPNLLALGYALGGYGLGLALLITTDGLAWFVGIAVLAHALIIAAYLLHEFAHETIFVRAETNHRWGRLFNWLVGGSYNDFAAVRHKHFRHHADKADVLAFDYRKWLKAHPFAARAVYLLEWCYIPAVDLLMHAWSVVLPFRSAKRADRRAKVLAVLALRAAVFATLAGYAPSAIVGYAIAYMMMLHVLRFMDAFQHNYPLILALDDRGPLPGKNSDRDFEQGHTFSNLHSVRWPWLNLLTLNFGYHNAHHRKPFLPWHRLPALHRELYGNDTSMLVPFGRQLAIYHRRRMERITNSDDPSPVAGTADRDYIGALGVSFLTAH